MALAMALMGSCHKGSLEPWAKRMMDFKRRGLSKEEKKTAMRPYCLSTSQPKAIKETKV